MFNLFTKKEKGYQQIEIAEFDELRKADDHVVLDVRSPEEAKKGTVPGHQLINYFDGDFKKELAALDRSKAYLIYCRSGMRSAKACKLMAGMGFARLYNLKGGIVAWNREQ